MEYLKSERFPCVKRGKLTWCEGDTFTFRINVTLTSMGAKIADDTGYVYVAEFFDASGKEILAVTEEGNGSGLFAIAFDAPTTSLFPRGRYFYDVHVLCPDGTRITAGNDLPISVV